MHRRIDEMPRMEGIEFDFCFGLSDKRECVDAARGNVKTYTKVKKLLNSMFVYD